MRRRDLRDLLRRVRAGVPRVRHQPVGGQISIRRAIAGVMETGSWSTGVEVSYFAVAVICARSRAFGPRYAAARQDYVSCQAGWPPPTGRAGGDHRPPLFSHDASEIVQSRNAPEFLAR